MPGNFYVHHDNVVRNRLENQRGEQRSFPPPGSPELGSNANFNGDRYSLVHSANSCLYQGVIERKAQ